MCFNLTQCVLTYLLIPSLLSFLRLFILTEFSPGYCSHISASLSIWSFLLTTVHCDFTLLIPDFFLSSCKED